MSLKIIQWNIKGYVNNYNELLLIIKEHSPKIITLQETHLCSIRNIPIPVNYKMYNINNSGNVYGGSALLIHNSLQHNVKFIDTTFDTLYATISSKSKFTIVSTYISPNTNFSLDQLVNTFGNITTPTIFTGDFNSWNKRWGSSLNNAKGNNLSKFINQSKFILLNDGSPTHFSTHSTFSHIDLTFSSPELAIGSTWYVLPDLHGSDHFPIFITIFPETSTDHVKTHPKFDIKRANWNKYNDRIIFYSKSRPVSSEVNKEAANIKKIIHQAANESIPLIKNDKSKNVPWWNIELEKLKKERNRL